MNITKYEQSGFLLETDKGFKLAVDIGSYTPVERLEHVQVDAMIVSHIHGDHFSLDQIKKLAPKKIYLGEECAEVLKQEISQFESGVIPEIIEIKGGQTLVIEDIQVECFEVNHGTNITKIPKQNFGFLFMLNGQKIYFAGDMFNTSGVNVTNLEVDIACIPVGTFYTFGPHEALDFVRTFKKINKIIPMHYEKNPETEKEFVDLATSVGFNCESLS